jgi:sugar phosphate isomerase/epimerase
MNPNSDSNFSEGERLKLGTTLFSFTDEWLSRRYTLEQLLGRASELGIGPGLELVGFQSIRGFPTIDSDFSFRFRHELDRHGLEPSALAAYVDFARRPGRTMSADEAVEMLVQQIDAARELGFPVLRLHTGIATDVIERATPVAERAGVTLATEVQGAQSPEHPDVAAVLECHDRLESANLGLLLDFSVSMTALPSIFTEQLARLGLAPALIGLVAELWEQGAPMHAIVRELADAPEEARNEAIAGLFRFGRQKPRSWLPLVPHVVHVHAKFWELDEAGDEPTMPYAELFGVLRDGGYSGFVSSEWGGGAWQEADDVDAFELVRRHHELCRRLISRKRENLLSVAADGAVATNERPIKEVGGGRA